MSERHESAGSDAPEHGASKAGTLPAQQRARSAASRRTAAQGAAVRRYHLLSGVSVAALLVATLLPVATYAGSP